MCLQALPFSYFRNDILQPIKSIKIHKEESKDNFGKLKLCPPGLFFLYFLYLKWKLQALKY